MWLLPGKHPNPSRLSWCSFSPLSILPWCTTAVFFFFLSRERFIAGPKKNKWLMLKNTNSYYSFLIEGFIMKFYNCPAPFAFPPRLEAPRVKGLSPHCFVSGKTNAQLVARKNKSMDGSQQKRSVCGQHTTFAKVKLALLASSTLFFFPYLSLSLPYQLLC